MKILISLLFVIFLSGCGTASVRTIDSRPDFSLQPQGNNGRLIISTFQIPKTEFGVNVFHFMALLGGAKTVQVPFKSKVYDVTNNEPKFIGSATNAAAWLEYSIPAGERVLMMDRTGTYTPDFLIVNIKPGETTHVAISQYGYMSYAYLGEIVMEKQDYNFCTGLQKQTERTASEYLRNWASFDSSAGKYVTDNHIASANAFRNYCTALALPVYVNVPDKIALDEFEKIKPDVVALRDQHFEKWKSDPDNKKPPFDLRNGDVQKPIERESVSAAF